MVIILSSLALVNNTFKESSRKLVKFWSAAGLYDVFTNTTKEFNKDQKFVAQSYDGGAVITGQLWVCKLKFASALFLHHFSHKLNLVLFQPINYIQAC